MKAQPNASIAKTTRTNSQRYVLLADPMGCEDDCSICDDRRYFLMGRHGVATVAE